MNVDKWYTNVEGLLKSGDWSKKSNHIVQWFSQNVSVEDRGQSFLNISRFTHERSRCSCTQTWLQFLELAAADSSSFVQLLQAYLNCDIHTYQDVASVITFVSKTLKQNAADFRLQTSLSLIKNENVIKLFTYFDNNLRLALCQLFTTILTDLDVASTKHIYAALADRILSMVHNLNDKRCDWYALAIQTMLSSLWPLCTSTNTFMVMTLSPNPLTLLLNQIPILSDWLTHGFPALSYTCLLLAYTFCKTHDFFTSTSKWIAAKTVIESPSAHFLETQVTVLSKVLACSDSCGQVVDLCLEWVFTIVTALRTDAPRTLDSSEFDSLRKSVFLVWLHDRDEKQSRVNFLMDALKALQTLAQLNSKDLSAALGIIFQKQNNDSVFALEKDFPFDVMIRNCTNNIDQVDEDGPGLLTKCASLINVSSILFSRTPHIKWSILEVKQMVRSLICTNELQNSTQMTTMLTAKLNEMISEIICRITEPTTNINTKLICAFTLIELVEAIEHASAIRSKRKNWAPTRPFNAFDFSWPVSFKLFEIAFDVGKPEFVIAKVSGFFQHRPKPCESVEMTESLTYLLWAFVLLKDVDSTKAVIALLPEDPSEPAPWIEPAQLFASGRFEQCLMRLDSMSNFPMGSAQSKLIFWLRKQCLNLISDVAQRRILAPDSLGNSSEQNVMLDNVVLMSLMQWDLPPDLQPQLPVTDTVDVIHSSVMQLLHSRLVSPQMFSEPMKNIFELQRQLAPLAVSVNQANLAPYWMPKLNALRIFLNVTNDPSHWVSFRLPEIQPGSVTVNALADLFAMGNDLGKYMKRSNVSELVHDSKLASWMSDIMAQLKNVKLCRSYSEQSQKSNPLRLFPDTQAEYVLKRLDVKADIADPDVWSDVTKLSGMFWQKCSTASDSSNFLAGMANKLGHFSSKGPQLATYVQNLQFPPQLLQSASELETICEHVGRENALAGCFLRLAQRMDSGSTRFAQDLLKWTEDMTFNVDNGKLKRKLSQEEQGLLLEITANEDQQQHLLDGLVRDTFPKFSTYLEQQGLSLTELSSEMAKLLFDSFKNREESLYSLGLESLLHIMSKKEADVAHYIRLLDYLQRNPNWFKRYESRFLKTAFDQKWMGKNSAVSGVMKTLLTPLIAEKPNAFCYHLLSSAKSNQDVETDDFVALIETFKSMHPDLSHQMELFLDDFDMVSLTVSEKWHYLLSHLSSDLSSLKKCLASLNQQVDAVLANPSDKKTFIDKVTTIFRDLVLDTMRRFADETNAFYPSPDVRRFRKHFLSIIEDTIEKASAIMSLDKILVMINKQDNGDLFLHALSPRLASTSKSAIPVPGHQSDEELQLISKFENKVHVLPTKTRPKKIALISNTGQRYSYLCKGQEDLRLDEIVSGFMRLCNSILLKTCRFLPHCPTYSVTSLSGRSGLIEWVDGGISIYQLYRRWHAKRVRGLNFVVDEHSACSNSPVTGQSGRSALSDVMADASQAAPNSNSSDEEVPHAQNGRDTRFRPVDMFYKTAVELGGLEGKTEFNYKLRKRLSDDVLHKVFLRMRANSPNDIISSQLRAESCNSKAWWFKVHNLARSMAASSVVGSVIDLGDRHLDNILVDIKSGRVVHVDYNVCFHKGTTLKVPEKVPFRLTQNLVTALGPWGTSGTFREVCHKVMSSLRSEAAVLTSYMRVIEQDPLPDFMSIQEVFPWCKLGLTSSLIAFGSDHRINLAMSTASAIFEALTQSCAKLMEQLRKSITSSLVIFLEKGPVLNDSESAIAIRNFGASLDTHKNMMQLLKPCIRLLATENDHFQDFVGDYRKLFSSPMASIVRSLAVGEPATVDVDAVQLALDNIDSIYEWLLQCPPSKHEGEVSFRPDANLLQAMTQRICGRVEAKLCGREPDSGCLYTSAEQADYLIKQAMDEHNLSAMYEGWMPWI